MKKRCSWCGEDELYIKYHDEEWGIPEFNDNKHFEFLVLESAQAGLSWITILRKRENYKKVYDNFNVNLVAQYDEEKVQELLKYDGIIRNEKKIRASINNAEKFIEVQNEFGSFSKYIWNFVEDQPIVNSWEVESNIPSKNELSEIISKDLKKRGFKFLGPTIVYSYLQAMGIINDHIVECFKYEELKSK